MKRTLLLVSALLAASRQLVGKCGVLGVFGTFGGKLQQRALEVAPHPAEGDPVNGVAPGTPFEKLPDSWVCPVCGVGKEEFSKE